MASLLVNGLSETHKNFLYNYAQEKLGSKSRSKAILDLINEKLNELKPVEIEDVKISIEKSKKKKRVQFSLLEHDYDNLKKIADSVDTSIQYYIIRLILRDLYNNNNILLGNQIEELRKSNYELHKIGVNINQIAKALNSGESCNIKNDLSKLNFILKNHIGYISDILYQSTKKY